ncbi:hypothetical protein K8O93_00760 [Gordonia bronchialis]|uniref:hypothetical protein n=1 Tax=Gordonia bronchialis TaxID=2054 RepID=UPI001CBC38C1|nr:hypothetical protein [Gordonia bronchialis]UAK38364.1 hypothetical protein K8O93_00760 [Gordonia bronchialis]
MSEVASLPRDWTPDVLDPIEREEYDHLAGFGLSPTEIVVRLGWPVDAMARRHYGRCR